MELSRILADTSLKSKEKVSLLARLVSTDPGVIPSLMAHATNASRTNLATVLEALEIVSQDASFVLPIDALQFARSHLSSSTARVKWEAAKVIGNSIRHYPAIAPDMVTPLLENSGDTGTVVRWSAARALSEILRLRLPLNEDLIPRISDIVLDEPKDSIARIYRKALADVAP